MTILLSILDVFFLVFHTAFTLFNMTGWAWKKTRRIHLLTTALTVFSWFVLGIFYGWGFCFCTEWHWRVRDALGKPIMSRSYIHFLVQEITGADVNPEFVDITVFMVFVLCTSLSVYLNMRDIRRAAKGV